MSQDTKNGLYRIQSLGDTKENWEKSDLVLLEREIAYEIDTGHYKIGDGTKTWNELEYSSVGQYNKDTNQEILGEIFNNYQNNKAYHYSHAEGDNTKALGIASHAEGKNTKTLGDYSHAEGNNTYSLSQDSHATGDSTIAGSKGYNIRSISVSNGTATITLKSALSDDIPINTLCTIRGNIEVCGCKFTKRVSNTQIQVSNVPNNLDLARIPIIGTPVPDESAYPHDVENYIVFAGYPQYGDKDIGFASYAGGYGTYTQGREAFAAGRENKVIGQYGVAFGRENLVGHAAFSNGRENQALGTHSHTEGAYNKALGDNTHVEGYENRATGDNAHAEGYSVEALGGNSHAEGWDTVAGGTASHAEGCETIASGENSHAEGYGTLASSNYAHAEGYSSKAEAYAAHAEGGSIASGNYSHAEGQTWATADHAHAEGYKSAANGTISHAEGQETVASGNISHAEGYKTQALGAGAHAEGQETVASGVDAHAEGRGTKSLGNYSHAEGYSTTAGTVDENNQPKNHYAHAEGYMTTASGAGSHAEGQNTFANGAVSHVEGKETIANGNYQHVQGKFNNHTALDSKGREFAHVVGGGEDDDHRKNIHTIDWDGNAYYAGVVECAGIKTITDIITLNPELLAGKNINQEPYISYNRDVMTWGTMGDGSTTRWYQIMPYNNADIYDIDVSLAPLDLSKFEPKDYGQAVKDYTAMKEAFDNAQFIGATNKQGDKNLNLLISTGEIPTINIELLVKVNRKI